jgi:cytoskeletal protein CcmA (bactofilin family)
MRWRGNQRGGGQTLAARSRGTVVALFLVLTSVLITSMVTTISLSGTTGVQTESLTLKRDQAFYAAEAGLQRALWMDKYGNWSGNSYPALTGTINGYSYSATLAGPSGNGVKIASVANATVGGITTSSTCSTVVSNSYPVPALELSANFSNGGIDQIVGDMKIDSNITINGTFADVTGNVYSDSSINGTITLSAGFKLFPNQSLTPAPTVISIANTLKANPNAVTVTSTNSLNFNSSSIGTLIYTGNINNWNNPTIAGNGTLVVFGDVSTSNMASFAGHNVNLVIAGNLNANGSNFTLTGSLYVEMGINANTAFSVVGVVLGNGPMNTQTMGSSIVVSTPPWFDPRLTGGGGSLVTGSFTGPIF